MTPRAPQADTTADPTAVAEPALDADRPEPTDDDAYARLAAVESVLDTVRYRQTELTERVVAVLGEPGAPVVSITDLHEAIGEVAFELTEATTPRAVRPVGVLAKVLRLMRLVNELGKTGTADPKMGGYAFRKVDDAINAVGSAMREIGLIMRTEIVDAVQQGRTAGQGYVTTARVTVNYVFVDPEDASEHVIQMCGEGFDRGDKSTSKAVSMALKYALLQGLMIPVEGVHLDIEADAVEQPPADRPRDDRRPADREQPRDERPARGPEPDPADPWDQGSPEYRDRQASERAAAQRPDPGATREAPADERPAARPEPEGSVDDPPEVRALAALRASSKASSVTGIDAIMQQAQKEGIANVEVEWHGATAKLRTHLIAAARLAARGSQ